MNYFKKKKKKERKNQKKGGVEIKVGLGGSLMSLKFGYFSGLGCGRFMLCYFIFFLYTISISIGF